MISRRTVAKSAVALPLFYTHARRALAGYGNSALVYDGDCGVASGNPTPDGVCLWTRVPASGRSGIRTGDSFAVRYEVSATPDFRTLAAAGEVETSAAHDYTVKAVLQGLAPFTTYYYRFFTDTGYTSVVGRTKTAPAPGTKPGRLRIGAVACQQFTAGFYSAYASLCREDLDYCLHLGDHIYEVERGRTGTVEPLGGREAKTLDDYRAKYRYYLSDPDYREARRLFAWVDLWDDHEVHNDYAGSVERAKDPARFAGAYRAFLEYMPIAHELIAGPGATPLVELYRTQAFGDLVELFVMDQRQYRSPSVCSTTYLSAGCDARLEPSRTMLGQAQKSWLKESLGQSSAQWKLLANEVMMAPLHVSLFGHGVPPETLGDAFFGASPRSFTDRFVTLDQWDGFPAERQDLLGFIGDNKISNVVVVTGDIHSAFLANLYRDPDVKVGQPVAVEVVVTSVSSKTLGEDVGSLLGGAAQSLIMSSNSHLVWSDMLNHGYTVLDVTAEKVNVRHVAVDSIARRTTGASVARLSSIPDGKAEFY